MATQDIQVSNPLTAQGDDLKTNGRIEEAIICYLGAANESETPPASVCLRLARCYEHIGDWTSAGKWALAVVDSGDGYSSWQAASTVLDRCISHGAISARRSVRVAVTGSVTTAQLAQMIKLAAARIGVLAEIYESPFGQYEQELINGQSELYAFAPDIIVLAVQERDLRLPQYSDLPDAEIAREVGRWAKLWEMVSKHSKARVIQYNFALPPESPMGHLGARLPGSRWMMTHAINARIGERAGNSVSIVDCDHLSALFGKQRWCDPRYWFLAKQGIALDALPLLSRHTAAVIAADLGLTKKCLVLDLDNTLWGGVIGEEGLSGIKLGEGADGEAFVAFQEYILKLKAKGVVLAVCSKNNEADAKEPFETHPEMRLKLQDFATFVANWQSKPENLRQIAKALDLGLDSLVFVDDNPVERAIVRKLVPEVDVVTLPADPAFYTKALADYLLFEATTFTQEDGQRTEQYRSRAQIMQLKASTSSLEEFYHGLCMKAFIGPFDDFNLPRIAQLIGKTNQFNLTTRRHGMPQLQDFLKNKDCVHFHLRLRDRFADHGLVGLMIALLHGTTLEIDTWLLSCRVLGRTVEATMLQYLFEQALQAGCTSVRGMYIPTAKNSMAKDVYGKYGFTLLEDSGSSSTWRYDLTRNLPVTNEFIELMRASEGTDGFTEAT